MNVFRVLSLSVALIGAAAGAANPDDIATRAARYESGGDIGPILQVERMLGESIGHPARRTQAEAALIRMLAPDATFEARRFACERLAVFGSDAALPAIAALLKDEPTIGLACIALGGLPSDRATALLIDALPAAGPDGRLQIISALGRRGEAAAVPALAALARDADAGLARAAIAALGRIPAQPARDALADLRTSSRGETGPDLAAATLDSAGRLAEHGDAAAAAAIYSETLQTAPCPHIRRGAYEALLHLDADGGMARIQSTLLASPRDALLVPVAIAHVARMNNPDASKMFAAAVTNLPPAEQAWMIESLAVRSDADARAAIRAQVASAHSEVRLASIAAVGRLEDGSAVPLLAARLAGGSDAEDKRAADLALTGLRGGAATDQAILDAMVQARGEARVALIGVLARRGAGTAAPALLAEADGADPAAARAAYQAMAKIGGTEHIPALMDRLVAMKDEALRADAETAAGRALARLPDAAARSRILLDALAATPGPEARGSLLRLLSVAGDAAALAAVRSAMADGDARVRDAAVRALSGWSDASAWDAVEAVYRNPESAAHRALAYRGLVRMAGGTGTSPDAAMMERYRMLAGEARSDDERKLLLGALAGVTHPDAMALALPMLDNPGVRAEAILALRRIISTVKPTHPKEAIAAWKLMKEAEAQP